MQITNGRVSGVRFVPANSSGAALSPSLIVVHDTAGRLNKFSSVDWFTSKGCKTSAHFVVELDGTITQMVRTDRRAFHAGQSVWNGKRFCNSFAVGIEIVNPGLLSEDGRAWFGKATDAPLTRKKTKEHGDGWWMPYPPAQIAAVKNLCRALMEEYPDCNEIVTHWMISPGRKIDTNPLFPLADVLAYAEGKDDTPVEKPSDIPVVAPPAPAPVTAPQADLKTVVAHSRKARLALWTQHIAKAFTFTAILEYAGVLKGLFDDVFQVVGDHANALAIVGGILVVSGLGYVLNLCVEDVQEGRSIPSGLANAAVGTPTAVVEPGNGASPVGQEA
jgi:N-acetylmuramoyl-L-alanine amidase